MTDCEGKDIQVGDEVLVAFRANGGGTYISRGTLLRFTKIQVLVKENKGGEYFCKSREIFKL